MKSLKVIAAVVLLGSAMMINSAAFAGNNGKGRGSEGSPVVYVTSQGLWYDSIVVVPDLPFKGNFQQLIPTEMGLTTEFGPGEVGHLGGRWWIDLNDNQTMDADDKYFLCPLLGPGRETM